jgi:hypothetical protein
MGLAEWVQPLALLVPSMRYAAHNLATII